MYWSALKSEAGKQNFSPFVLTFCSAEQVCGRDIQCWMARINVNFTVTSEPFTSRPRDLMPASLMQGRQLPAAQPELSWSEPPSLLGVPTKPLCCIPFSYLIPTPPSYIKSSLTPLCPDDSVTFFNYSIYWNS